MPTATLSSKSIARPSFRSGFLERNVLMDGRLKGEVRVVTRLKRVSDEFADDFERDPLTQQHTHERMPEHMKREILDRCRDRFPVLVLIEPKAGTIDPPALIRDDVAGIFFQVVKYL